MAISRLHHENIVRYYQAWLEGDENDHVDDTNSIKHFSNSSEPDIAVFESNEESNKDEDDISYSNEPTVTSNYDWLVFENGDDSIIEYCKNVIDCLLIT